MQGMQGEFMAREIAQVYKDKLPTIKRNIEQSSQYFKKNYDRYQRFMKFVFDTSLSPNDLATLKALNKPNLEFGILEAYINRRVGEFALHEPDLEVRAADGLTTAQINENLTTTINVVEGHVREIIDNVNSDGFRSQLYKDTMGGGFSVAEVYTDYLHDMTFEQCIKVERVFNPALCGFDPLARESHKGDGQYCFKITPRTKEEFETEYGKEATLGMSFTRNVDVNGFSWSYENQQQKILLVVDYFCKESKREKIAKLTNGHVILAKHYEQLLDIWQKQGRIEQPPMIVQERWSQIESIWHYRVCENKMLEARQTNYRYLPLVFFDGNSVTVESSPGNASYQMTRPYVYQAEGVQRLKNFAGQSIGAELETMVQHKFMVAIESIPEDYIDAYTNPQQAQVLAYNAFYDKNPQLPLPAPQVIQRTDTPAIVQATFEGTDRTTQAILGSFDAQQGVVGDRISGRAIEMGAIQSDAASLPYLENFIKGMNRIGQILLDLIPKYYVTPRSIPIRKANGLRSYQVINDPTSEDSIDLNYDPMSLQIKIKAGVNSSMQKRYALDQITRLMQSSESFSAFMNSVGLDILVQNLDINGVEELKKRAADFIEAQQKAEQAAKEQPDPMQEIIQLEQAKIEGQQRLEAEKIMQRRDEAQAKQANEAARVAIDEQKAQIDFYKMIAELEEKARRQAMEESKNAEEQAREAITLAMDVQKTQFDMNKNQRVENLQDLAIFEQGQNSSFEENQRGE